MSRRGARARPEVDLGPEEQCPHCLALVERAEVRICSSCDAPVCLHCVRIVGGEPLCPSCESGEQR